MLGNLIALGVTVKTLDFITDKAEKKKKKKKDKNCIFKN